MNITAFDHLPWGWVRLTDLAAETGRTPADLLSVETIGAYSKDAPALTVVTTVQNHAEFHQDVLNVLMEDLPGEVYVPAGYALDIVHDRRPCVRCHYPDSAHYPRDASSPAERAICCACLRQQAGVPEPQRMHGDAVATAYNDDQSKASVHAALARLDIDPRQVPACLNFTCPDCGEFIPYHQRCLGYGYGLPCEFCTRTEGE